jgi:hypothetical protein
MESHFSTGAKGTPVLSEKNFWLADYFSLAVFFFVEIVFATPATQIDSVLLGDEEPLQIIGDAANVVRFVSF